MLADTIIRHIETLGYTVDCRVVGDTFVAVAEGKDRHEVCGEHEYDAACQLAEAVGIELIDG